MFSIFLRGFSLCALASSNSPKTGMGLRTLIRHCNSISCLSLLALQQSGDQSILSEQVLALPVTLNWTNGWMARIFHYNITNQLKMLHISSTAIGRIATWDIILHILSLLYNNWVCVCISPSGEL